MVTVKDVWKSALPAGTELVAGDAGLAREVSWVASLRSRPPAFDALKGGEIALVSLSALRMLDERVTLTELIDRLRGVGIAAIAVSSGVPDAAAADASNTYGVPLFHMPGDLIVNEVEGSVARMLVERRSALYTRSQELNRQFMEMAIEGKGVSAIIRALSGVSGKAAVLEDEEFRLRAHEAPEGLLALPEEILPFLEANRDSVSTWLRGRKLSPSEPPTSVFPWPTTPFAIVVAPVVTRDRVLAYLSLIGFADEIAELDHLTVSRGAAALAIELARERAVLDAQDRMQEGFVDALLNGGYPGEEIMLSRAKRLGFDMSARHAVLVFRLPSSRPPSGSLAGGDVDLSRDDRTPMDVERVLGREIHRRGVEAPMRIKGDSVALLYPVGEASTERQLKDLAEDLMVNLSGSLGGQVSVGIGRLHKGLDGLRTAYREAEQAVGLGIRLFGRGSATYFGDLGLYRLLLGMVGNPELRTFYQETLGKLLDYDRKNGSELVKTLEAFFASCGSPTEAAERLHLHRNTLLYRLHRIREISGLDLDDPEIRLSLHLALRIGQSLAASRGNVPQSSASKSKR